jgi:hypothetical protein
VFLVRFVWKKLIVNLEKDTEEHLGLFGAQGSNDEAVPDDVCASGGAEGVHAYRHSKTGHETVRKCCMSIRAAVCGMDQPLFGWVMMDESRLVSRRYMSSEARDVFASRVAILFPGQVRNLSRFFGCFVPQLKGGNFLLAFPWTAGLAIRRHGRCRV